MVRIFSGAVLIIAGIAGFIAVHSHPYGAASPRETENERGWRRAPAGIRHKTF